MLKRIGMVPSSLVTENHQRTDVYFPDPFALNHTRPTSSSP
jgi:hypothetical protein